MHHLAFYFVRNSPSLITQCATNKKYCFPQKTLVSSFSISVGYVLILPIISVWKNKVVFTHYFRLGIISIWLLKYVSYSLSFISILVLKFYPGILSMHNQILEKKKKPLRWYFNLLALFNSWLRVHNHIICHILELVQFCSIQILLIPQHLPPNNLP